MMNDGSFPAGSGPLSVSGAHEARRGEGGERSPSGQMALEAAVRIHACRRLRTKLARRPQIRTSSVAVVSAFRTRPVTDDDIAPLSGASIQVIPRPDAVRRAYSSLDDREPSSCGQGCRAPWDSSVEAHPFSVCPVFRGAAAGRCPSLATGGLRRLTGARSHGHAHGGLSAAEVSAVLPAIV